jgi:hypothetical protein
LACTRCRRSSRRDRLWRRNAHARGSVTTCYLTGRSGVEFSAIRLHYRGVDEICRAFGASALTIGSDIYFRQEAFAPRTPEGLRLLAHEVAHVVQQRRGAIAVPQAAGGLAADALLEQLGRDPRHVDEERLQAEHPGAQTLCLPGSGLVVTLGELNVLPDYLAHPAEIENAPEAFLLPADPVGPEPEHRRTAPPGGIRVPARPASPATGLAEIPAAAPAGRDRRGPGGRCAGTALRVRAVEAVFLCRRA